MTKPHHWDWSVVPWSRFDEDFPTLRWKVHGPDAPPGAPPETYVREPDTEWSARHTRRGARIHDAKRGITYSATIDPTTLELDFLSVTMEGAIVGQPFASIPLDRIQRVVRDQVIEEDRARQAAGHGDVFVATLPGGLVVGDGSKGKPPTTHEIAELLTRGLDRHAIAKIYDRPVRTVDTWIRKARRDHGDALPKPTRGRPSAGKSSAQRIRDNANGNRHGR